MSDIAQGVIQARSELSFTQQAIKSGKLTVGFIGGSITDGRPEYNWPEFVQRWLTYKYPKVFINVENASVGGSGSDLGLFHVDRDIIQRGCDLIFVEYAVNDASMLTSIRMKSREGLIRKLLAQSKADVVFVYTYMHEMFDDMNANKIPVSIAELELLAENYKLNSVWMGKYAFQLWLCGMLRYDQWLPDNLHPRELGSKIYADAVISLLSERLDRVPEMPIQIELEAPVDVDHWEHATHVNLSMVEFDGPWFAYRSHSLVWADKIYTTNVAGSRIRVQFEGRGIYLISNFGKKSADYFYSIDKQDFQCSQQDYPQWCADIGWMRAQMLAYPVAPGNHMIEIEIVNPMKQNPTAIRFDLIGFMIVP